MVEIISTENAHLYRDILHDMHRMRYRVAVEEWGWRIPGSEQGYDKDEFDTNATIYFVSIDATETRVVACGRLNPTTGPHLLSEKFRNHCHSGVAPSDPAIYELSRYIVDHRALSKQQQFAVRGRISSAFNLFCLQTGIRRITALTYMNSYARSLKFWPTRPLGLPIYYEQDNASYIAAICEMTSLGLERLRKGFGLSPDEPHLHTRADGTMLACVARIRAATGGQPAAA